MFLDLGISGPDKETAQLCPKRKQFYTSVKYKWPKKTLCYCINPWCVHFLNRQLLSLKLIKRSRSKRGRRGRPYMWKYFWARACIWKRQQSQYARGSFDEVAAGEKQSGNDYSSVLKMQELDGIQQILPDRLRSTRKYFICTVRSTLCSGCG